MTTPKHTAHLPATSKTKFGVAAGRSDVRMTHIVKTVELLWDSGEPVGMGATWACGGAAADARLRAEPTDAQPLCRGCHLADTTPGPFVYFAARDGLVKIGFSACPARRAAQLRADLLAFTLGDLTAERATHQRFAADRVVGEWFRPSDALMSYIAELQEVAA